MEDVVFQQQIDQSFQDFIFSYVESFYNYLSENEKRGFQYELAANESRLFFLDKYKNISLSPPYDFSIGEDGKTIELKDNLDDNIEVKIN